MENLKLLRVNFLKLEFSKPIQGHSWAPVGFFEASSFPNQPKDLFSKRNENLNIIKPTIKHIPLPHTGFILLFEWVLKVLCSTYGHFCSLWIILHSPTF